MDSSTYQRSRRVHVAVAWSGLPWYAGRLLRAGVRSGVAEVAVLGTRPETPMDGLEAIIGQPVTWLEKFSEYSWSQLGQGVPEIFIHTGWNIPCFNSLAREVRRHGGHVVSMIDNSHKGNARQCLGAIVFRLLYRRRFDAVWVPGASGKKLLSFFGMPPDRIYEGQYGADPTFFELGPPLEERPKEILYVGQLIARKGVVPLVRAFRLSGLASQGWTLRILGEGPERAVLDAGGGISLEGFRAEGEVAAAMRQARIFVLPSHEEHWGVVLAEAALSGCVLAASATVGAAADLLGPENGLRFEAGNLEDIARKLQILAGWPATDLTKARLQSRALGEKFGPIRWATELTKIVDRFSRRP